MKAASLLHLYAHRQATALSAATQIELFRARRRILITMLRILYLFAFALCLLADNTERIARVDAGLRPGTQLAGESPVRWTLEKRMAHHKVPALSVAVINGGKIEWAKAYGVVDATATQPVNTDTLFQAASISKPVSAIAALRLVAEGKLNLDGDVSPALTSWKVPPH